MGDIGSSIFGSGGREQSEQQSNNSYRNDPVNTYSPWGSVTYKRFEDDDDSDIVYYNQSTVLSPTEQYKLDAKNAAQMAVIDYIMGSGTGNASTSYKSSAPTYNTGGTGGVDNYNNKYNNNDNPYNNKFNSSGDTQNVTYWNGRGGNTDTKGKPVASGQWYQRTGYDNNEWMESQGRTGLPTHGKDEYYEDAFWKYVPAATKKTSTVTTATPKKTTIDTSSSSKSSNKAYSSDFNVGPDSLFGRAMKQVIQPLDSSGLWDLSSSNLANDMGYVTGMASENLPWSYEKNGLRYYPDFEKWYKTDPLSSGQGASMNWITDALGDYTSKYNTDYRTDYFTNFNTNFNTEFNKDFNRNFYKNFKDEAFVDEDAYRKRVDINDDYTDFVNLDSSYRDNVDIKDNYKYTADIDDTYKKSVLEQMENPEYSKSYLTKLDDYNFAKNAMLGEEYDSAYNKLFNTYKQGFDEEQDRLFDNLSQRMANQGLSLGNTAYDRSMLDYNNNYYKQLNKLQQQASSDAYNYALQNAQLRNDATQKQAENQLAEENLYNSALSKEFENVMADTNLWNSVTNQLNDYSFKNAEMTNSVLDRLNNYSFQNAALRNDVLDKLNNYAFQNADIRNNVLNYLNNYEFQNAQLNNAVVNQLNDYSFKNAELFNNALNYKNQALGMENDVVNLINNALAGENQAIAMQNQAYDLQNSALDRYNNVLNNYNNLMNSWDQLAIANAGINNDAVKAQKAFDLQEAQQYNDALNQFGALALKQQEQNNEALNNLQKYRIMSQSTVNDTIQNAYASAMGLNNQNLSQQMTQNAYLANLLMSLLGGTSVTLPTGYNGAALSGTGSAYGSASSQASSGGLLNSLSAWF